MTKSEAAFILSAQEFFDQTPYVYFWTFTVVGVYPDWCYSQIWCRFIRSLCDLYGNTLRGLKVVELHKKHGIHWHALLNKRIWVGEVRRIGKRYGIGRVHVKLANRGSIAYLAKYVSKQFKSEQRLHARCCRWGTVGGFRGVRVKDIQIDSVFHRAVKFCQRELGVRKLPYIFVRALLQKRTEDPVLLGRACNVFRDTGSISMIWAPERSQVGPDAAARNLRAVRR